MSNQNKQNDWPEAEHRELDPFLAELVHLRPRKGFVDAVMARVRFPPGPSCYNLPDPLAPDWGGPFTEGIRSHQPLRGP